MPRRVGQQWLRDRIDASNRLARRRRCPKCGAWVWEGLDADDVAMLTRVDVEAVDRLTEMRWLLNGRRSCNLVNGKLYHREPHHTREMQASVGKLNVNKPEKEQPIHLEHRCHYMNASQEYDAPE